MKSQEQEFNETATKVEEPVGGGGGTNYFKRAGILKFF